jgi:hypothetical protein
MVLTSALDTAAVFPNSALVLIWFNKGLQQEFDLIRLVLQPSLILLQHISNMILASVSQASVKQKSRLKLYLGFQLLLVLLYHHTKLFPKK